MDSTRKDCSEYYPKVHLRPPDCAGQSSEYRPKTRNVEKLNEECPSCRNGNEVNTVRVSNARCLPVVRPENLVDYRTVNHIAQYEKYKAADK